MPRRDPVDAWPTMTIVDTSVWIDFLRTGDPDLQRMLDANQVLMHPMIVGELACGRITEREVVLNLLQRLPSAPVASHREVLTFMGTQGLMGTGIGYVDAHLLAAAALAAPTQIWTRDRALGTAGQSLGLVWT